MLLPLTVKDLLGGFGQMSGGAVTTLIHHNS